MTVTLDSFCNPCKVFSHILSFNTLPCALKGGIPAWSSHWRIRKLRGWSLNKKKIFYTQYHSTSLDNWPCQLTRQYKENDEQEQTTKKTSWPWLSQREELQQGEKPIDVDSEHSGDHYKNAIRDGGSTVL